MKKCIDASCGLCNKYSHGSDASEGNLEIGDTRLMSRIIKALILLTFICITGGFVALALWDVPVKETPVEKTLDNSGFLAKAP